MPTLLSFLLRAIIVAFGLLFAAFVACVFVLMLSLWLLRAAWCKLTGRPVTPFVMRMGPRSAFDDMMRRARAQQPASRTPRADAAAGPRTAIAADVTDVEPK